MIVMGKKKQSKTNAARILDTMEIHYTLKEYSVDESDLSAVHVAASIGMPVEMIFKTLVARGDKTGILMAVIPGAKELDMKAIANISGNKRVEMVPMKEIFALTGYIRGGCSPLGAKKPYPIYIDARVRGQKEVVVSAGKRGEQLVLAPEDLIRATNATVGELIR